MKKNIGWIIAIFLLSSLVGNITSVSASECKSATQKNCTITVRDSRGIKTGSIDVGSSGTSTVRNSSGIKTGTMTQQSPKSNCVILRDARGIKIGSKGC